MHHQHNMHYPQDNIHMHLTELLAAPLVHRCAELGLLIDRCTVKDLQHFFPLLVQSIFGNAPGSSPCGWGLRTAVGHPGTQEFDVLYSFLLPMGPMFRLCYRLLSDAIKFDVPIEHLPPKTADMFYGGRYAPFYADMVAVDPHVRRIGALSMNAFDYYMLHFALHGMHPLHLQHPLAMDVHNEKRKTAYVFLVADYMCSFLPSHPEAVVLPSNVCGTAKMSSVLQPIQQSVQHARSPKYLKLSALNASPNASAAATGVGSPLLRPTTPGTPTSHTLSLSGSLSASAGGGYQTPNTTHTHHHHHHHRHHQSHPDTGCWRTESVLHLFVDTWLRCDVTAHLDLPSSEFVRAVRICVKQLHAFANAAELDHNPAMVALRSAVPALIGAPMYQLLRTLIRRWPMDSSFAVVLELWLSYIQPWRYSFERVHSGGQLPLPPITLVQRRFEPFVRDNMRAYTQILVQMLPLFERLNFGSLKNVLMMSRLLKVFAQTNLAELLRANEFDVFASVSFMAQSTSSSPNRSHKPASGGGGGSFSGQLRPRSPAFQQHSHHRSGSSVAEAAIAAGHDDDASAYVCMFGDEVQQQMMHIGRRMQLARQTGLQQAAHLQADADRRLGGSVWRRWLHWLVVLDEDVEFSRRLAECQKIAELLDGMLQQLQQIFDVTLPEMEAVSSPLRGCDVGARNMLLDETTDGNQSFDLSMSYAESAFNGTLKPPNSITYTVDPAIVPATSYELTVLVRFLYELAAKLNVMYPRQLEQCWYRNDLVGRCARQVLSAPLVVHSFDKSDGVSRVCERRLRPRVNLRPLASFRALSLIGGSFLVGQLWWGVPSFGFIALVLLAAMYVMVMGVFGSRLS